MLAGSDQPFDSRGKNKLSVRSDNASVAPAHSQAQTEHSDKPDDAVLQSVTLGVYAASARAFEAAEALLLSLHLKKVIPLLQSGERPPCQDDIRSVDVILCLNDVLLPDMLKDLKHIRAQRSLYDLPILIMKREDADKEDEASIAAFVNDYLRAPLHMAELNARLKNHAQIAATDRKLHYFRHFYDAELDGAYEMIREIESPQSIALPNTHGKAVHISVSGTQSFPHAPQGQKHEEKACISDRLANHTEYMQGAVIKQRDTAYACIFTLRGRLFPAMAATLLKGRFYHLVESYAPFLKCETLEAEMRQAMARLLPAGQDSKLLCLQWGADLDAPIWGGDMQSFRVYTPEGEKWYARDFQEAAAAAALEMIITRMTMPQGRGHEWAQLSLYPYLHIQPAGAGA